MNIPNIIYKYRNWQVLHHQKALLNNEIYLTPPFQMANPFELKIYFDGQLLKSEQAIKQYCRKRLMGGTIANIEEIIEDFENEYIQMAKNDPEGFNQLLNDKSYYNSQPFNVFCGSLQWGNHQL